MSEVQNAAGVARARQTGAIVVVDILQALKDRIGELIVDADGWTLRSATGCHAAHAEHTIAVTDDAAGVLTLPTVRTSSTETEVIRTDSPGCRSGGDFLVAIRGYFAVATGTWTPRRSDRDYLNIDTKRLRHDRSAPVHAYSGRGLSRG